MLSGDAKTKLLEFIQHAGGHPCTAALRGYLFEQHGHNAMQAGLQVQMRQLHPGSEGLPGTSSQSAPAAKRRRGEKGAVQEERGDEDQEEEDEEGDKQHVSCALSHQWTDLDQR